MYHYIEKGDGGRKKKHSYYFYYFPFFTNGVAADFPMYPCAPSAHVGTIHFKKRGDILAYESQQKEKHSSEVSL